MQTAIAHETPRAPTRRNLWIARVLGFVPALMMIGSGTAKLMHAPGFVAKWTDFFGWPESALTAIGVVELACVALFLLPRTAVLGAVLLSAYLGGAVATHVRVGDAFVVPIVLGVFFWGSLYLRDERVRALLPGVSRRTA